MSNLVASSRTSAFIESSESLNKIAGELFFGLFTEQLTEIAGGLIKSAIPGQQAAEKETTKSLVDMLNIPTPAKDGNIYIKSKRGNNSGPEPVITSHLFVQTWWTICYCITTMRALRWSSPAALLLCSRTRAQRF